MGEGDHAVRQALQEVRHFCGGSLPQGRYQVIESRSGDTRWHSFELDADGQILD